MIGIVAAMNEEIEAFKSIVPNLTYHEEDNFSYYDGKIDDEDIILIQSGIGKVGCALNLTKLIERKHPELIINIGCAGSLKKDIRVNDVVIATKTAFYDMDVPGWEKSFDNPKINALADEECLSIAKNIKFSYPVHFGEIASGDSFVIKGYLTDKILKEFPTALCAEMEAGVLGRVCNSYHIPFMILRAISDVTIEDDNEIQFDEFVISSSKRSALFTKSFIEEYHARH